MIRSLAACLRKLTGLNSVTLNPKTRLPVLKLWLAKEVVVKSSDCGDVVEFINTIKRVERVRGLSVVRIENGDMLAYWN